MRHLRLIAIVFVATLSAYDAVQSAPRSLENLERTIDVEPAYASEDPKYCLLVFGRDLTTRIWLVHDEETLYVDRNGNGDLTEPGEKVAASDDFTIADKGIYHFEVGEIRDGELTHKACRVRTQGGGYAVQCDIQMPGWDGTGIDGRVRQKAHVDGQGRLKFAEDPQQAPVIQFHGPWESTLWGRAELVVDRQVELWLGMGTPGVGPGATAFVSHDRIVPQSVFAQVEVQLPAEDGQGSESATYALTDRCCTYNFHGPVRIPSTVDAGTARVKVSLKNWIGVSVSPSEHTVKLIAPAAPIELEPVSPRLANSLIHPSRDAAIYGIRFTPDGGRLIAGDYPGGTVVLWDIATGEQLTTMEAGFGYRGSADYFHVSPKWKKIYTWHENRKHSRIEKDGKQLIRWQFDGAVRAWDLDTGALSALWQHSPPRNIRGSTLSPNGATLLTAEELPGDQEGAPKRAVSVWNTKTGEYRTLPAGLNGSFAFSPDSKRFAIVADAGDHEGFSGAIKIIDVTSGDQMLSIPIAEANALVTGSVFSANSSTLIANVRVYAKQLDRKHWKSSLRFWDVATGDEVASFPAEEENTSFSWLETSPDGNTLAITNYDANEAKLYLFDVKSQSLQNTISFGEKAHVYRPAFSPDRRWIAVPTQAEPEQQRSENPSPLDKPQPRIHLIDAGTGKIRETIVSPQAFATCVCFSPDGKFLASSGHGRVLLWDLTAPPGEYASQDGG